MVMDMMGPGGPPMGGVPQGTDIDQMLISKVMALPPELKQTLLDIISKMELPSAGAPVGPGLEGNLTGGGGPPMM